MVVVGRLIDTSKRSRNVGEVRRIVARSLVVTQCATGVQVCSSRVLDSINGRVSATVLPTHLYYATRWEGYHTFIVPLFYTILSAAVAEVRQTRTNRRDYPRKTCDQAQRQIAIGATAIGRAVRNRITVGGCDSLAVPEQLQSHTILVRPYAIVGKVGAHIVRCPEIAG
jgi:hypothetical protein